MYINPRRDKLLDLMHDARDFQKQKTGKKKKTHEYVSPSFLVDFACAQAHGTKFLAVYIWKPCNKV